MSGGAVWAGGVVVEEKGKVVRFTRYERLDEPQPDRARDFMTLTEMMLAMYKRDLEVFPLPKDTRPWWRKKWDLFCYRLDFWIPRIHLGPCDHDECGY